MKATYYWTSLDVKNASKEGILTSHGIERWKLVSKGFTPTSLTAGKAIEVQTEWTSVASLYQDRWKLQNFQWLPIPKAIREKKPDTFEKLCKALTEMNDKLYPPSLYGRFATSKGGQYHWMPFLIFDHPDNALGRWLVVESGQHDCSADPKTFLTGVDLTPVPEWKVPTYVEPPPPPKCVSHGGSPQVVLNDLLGNAILNRSKQIEETAGKLHAALLDAARVNEQRVQVLSKFNALYVLFKCVGRNLQDANEGDAVAAEVAKLLPTIREKAYRTPVKDLLAHQVPAWMKSDPLLMIPMGDAEAYAGDYAADVENHANSLKSDLLYDARFRDQCLSYFKTAYDNGQQGSPRFAEVVNALAHALTVGYVALAEASGDGQLLLDILEKAPAERAKSSGDIKGETTTEAVLSVMGHMYGYLQSSAGVVNTATGNLAGPPSLSVALYQAGALWSIGKAARAAKGGDYSELRGLRGAAMKHFRKLDFFKGEVDDLEKALESNDPLRIRKAHQSIVDKAGGGVQSSAGWKAATTAFQVISLIAAIEDAHAKSNDPKADRMVRGVAWAGAAGAGASVALGGLELLLTAVGQFDRFAEIFSVAGNVLGKVNALIAITAGVIQFVTILEDPNHSNYDLVGVGMQTLGSVILLFAAASNPIGAAIGLALMIAGMIVAAWDDESAPAPQIPNLVSESMFADLYKTPFYVAMVRDSDLADKIHQLRQRAQKALLPCAPNSGEILESLRQAGFSDATARRVASVGTVTSGLPDLWKSNPKLFLIRAPE